MVKINNKLYNSQLYIVYFIMLTLAIVIRIPILQYIILIICCYILNFIIYHRFNIKDKKFYYIVFLIIAVNIFLIFFNYYQAVKLGFSDGLLHGDVGDFFYSDTWQYYYESKELLNIWNNGGFILWLTGNLSKGNGYGYYHFFNIWNSFVEILIGDDLNSLIIFKFQFSILSTYILYNISIEFLKFKYARVAVILMSFFPGYLLVNTQLMRDNIIYFLVLLVSYKVIKNKYSMLKTKKSSLVTIILLIILITYIRFYIGIIIGISIAFYKLLGNIKIKQIVIFLICSVLFIYAFGKISEVLGWGFMGMSLIQSGDLSGSQWLADRVSTPSKLVFYSFYNIFTGGRAPIKQMTYYTILDFFNIISPLFIAMLVLPTVFMIPILIKKEKVKYFFILSICISMGMGIITTYGFTMIISRLYINWIWSQIILFLYIIQYYSMKNREIKNFMLLIYLIYILNVGIFFVK